MKPVAILLSLALGAAAQGLTGEVTGNIRGRKLVTHKIKSDAGTSSRSGTKRKKAKNKVSGDRKLSLTNRNLKDDKYMKARQKLVRRKDVGDKLHDVLIKKKGRGLKDVEANDMEEKKEGNILTTNVDGKPYAKGQLPNEQDRELKKAKTFKGDVGNDWDDDDNYGYSKGGKIPGNGSGKSGYSGGSGKSGKGSESIGDPEYIGSGGSGKSGKSGGGTCGDYHYVEVTNLSYEQAFSEIFIMTAAHEVTELMPLFIVGNASNAALASLSKDAEASKMMDRYLNRRGVEQVKIFSDFDEFGIEVGPYLPGGATAKFQVSTSGYGERLTIAVGLPFTNDGVVILQGAEIYDGAVYLIPALDAGVETNVHTCWSVAASQADFPEQSACADDDLSDLNANNLPGEGFVHMHRGFQNIDSEEEFEALLLFPECSEILDEAQLDGTERFSRYFYEVGFDDDFLLCGDIDPGFGIGGSGVCGNPRDDQEFLEIISNYDDYADNRYVELAQESEDFDEFCDALTDANEELEKLFVQLEPYLFDWRNEMMHVKIHCGHHENMLRDSSQRLNTNQMTELEKVKQELNKVKQELGKVTPVKEKRVGEVEVAGIIPFVDVMQGQQGSKTVNGTKPEAAPLN